MESDPAALVGWRPAQQRNASDADGGSKSSAPPIRYNAPDDVSAFSFSSASIQPTSSVVKSVDFTGYRVSTTNPSYLRKLRPASEHDRAAELREPPGRRGPAGPYR